MRRTKTVFERPRSAWPPVCLLVLLILPILPVGAPSASGEAQTQAPIPDSEFWNLVTSLSEPGGRFAPQLMSNEDSALFVIPELKESTPPGGVYLGVGSEQNFTYIAAVQPRLAFVVDIRRDNMLQHLIYKALFELSEDRSEFVSRLFSRERPPDLDQDSTVTTVFDALAQMDPSDSLFEENLGAVTDRLVRVHGFPLTEADLAGIAEVMRALYAAGPDGLQGFGDRTNPTYARLMAATDLTGKEQSYLATEDGFQSVRRLEVRNLVIPLVGDFAGDKTLVELGAYLAGRSAAVDVFYVSNVERYLFDQGEPGMRFYANVRALPLGPSSTFIRSVTSDISFRLGIPIPDQPTKWRTFLSPIEDDLEAFEEGRIESYRDLFVD